MFGGGFNPYGGGRGRGGRGGRGGFGRGRGGQHAGIRPDNQYPGMMPGYDDDFSDDNFSDDDGMMGRGGMHPGMMGRGSGMPPGMMGGGMGPGGSPGGWPGLGGRPSPYGRAYELGDDEGMIEEMLDMLHEMGVQMPPPRGSRGPFH